MRLCLIVMVLSGAVGAQDALPPAPISVELRVEIEGKPYLGEVIALVFNKDPKDLTVITRGHREGRRLVFDRGVADDEEIVVQIWAAGHVLDLKAMLGRYLRAEFGSIWTMEIDMPPFASACAKSIGEDGLKNAIEVFCLLYESREYQSIGQHIIRSKQ